MNPTPTPIEGNAVFWIEVEKIHPNPYQPRREFNEAALRDLAESIRMYGVLQPLVVTRVEKSKEDGGIAVEYELISGERRLRASRLAGLREVPSIIRTDAQDSRIKLELAIIENLQREDLNPVDRARSFDRLVKEFNMKHVDIAKKMGKSREYVSNSLRLLALPEDILNALSEGKLTEGHARPLMMLVDRPQEQSTLFKEIIFRRLTVREAEAIARKIAVDRIRKKERMFDPELVEMERKLASSLGTRVQIEHKQNGGKIVIDFFGNDDLKAILAMIQDARANGTIVPATVAEVATIAKEVEQATQPVETSTGEVASVITETATPIDDRPKEEVKQEENDEDLYSIKNFSL
jgi:ParB family chromosome partitioning protein